MNEISVPEMAIKEAQDRWYGVVAQGREKYKNARPFPFLIIDDFLKKNEARSASRSFPQSNVKTWTNYTHVNERKFGLSKREYIPESLLKIIDDLQSSEFIANLSAITGIPGLMADDQLAGGGLHQVYPGGFLNIHSDFRLHPVKKHLERRINLILFLSDDWKEEYGGDLEFWNSDMTQCITRVQPAFNRCVIFRTDELSYHGCPDKLGGPPEFSRKSIALYYYTEYVQPPSKLFTDYKARPADKNKLAIWLDGKAVACYSWIKTRFGLSDDFASRLLRLLRK